MDDLYQNFFNLPDTRSLKSQRTLRSIIGARIAGSSVIKLVLEYRLIDVCIFSAYIGNIDASMKNSMLPTVKYRESEILR